MQQYWTLQVRDFGRIKSAEIKIAPMLMFFGQNNTGKSYITSLLWGIFQYEGVFPKKIPSDSLYETCREYFISFFENRMDRIEKKFIKSLFSFYSSCLQKQKNKIVRKIFSTENLDIGYVSIDIKENDISDVQIEWCETENFYGFNGNQFLYEDSVELTDGDIYDFITSLIYMLLFDKFGSPLYLPASRTGFMLSYKPLTANLMEEWGIGRKVQNYFPYTVIRFLQNLTYAEFDSKGASPPKKNINIAESLEKDILEGSVKQFSKPAEGFYYTSDLLEEPLPFHLTSSLVSELAPLIIFLKSKRTEFEDFDLYIFEEPESHLHLKAQRSLAKYLVKLVNNDIGIWLTTHSDIFFQQINNLIASNDGKRALLKQLAYNDDEMLNPENIRAYQFDITKEGLTKTSSLELTEDGFAVPTFNETIWNLSQETMRLESGSENAE